LPLKIGRAPKGNNRISKNPVSLFYCCWFRNPTKPPVEEKVVEIPMIYKVLALYIPGGFLARFLNHQLVGGFNPFEKYARQIGSFPQGGRGGNSQNI